jgi:uncharacterized membrane protein YeaQ/YmgE (transglycosylase-associated protein family)
MMPSHSATAHLHAARDYAMIEIGKASAIVLIAIVGFVVALSYPSTVAWIVVGMVAGLIASRVWWTSGMRPHRTALATTISHVGRRQDRSV